jgi:hypothetical protein
MSQHIYARELVGGAYNFPNPSRCDAAGASILPTTEIAAALPGKQFTLRCAGTVITLDFTATLTAGEITTLDQAIVDHKVNTNALVCAKAAKVAAIDARTDELIAAGFTYASKQFSLSLTAQAKMMGTHQVKDNVALIYPINWNTIDDLDVYAIANAADLEGFYLTGLGTVRARLDSGTTLKDAVRAAADQAALDAVVDTR